MLALKMSPILKTAFRVGGALVLLASPLLLYGAWMWWDIHKVTSFCQDVHPGALLTTLPQLAAEHGISRHWIANGIFDEKQKDWVFFVPAGSTMGDVACSIHHNKVAVVSVQMDSL